MAAPLAATSYATAVNLTERNIQSLHFSVTDLKARLQTWKDSYFALLDQSVQGQEQAHRWIIPVDVMLRELPDNAFSVYQVDDIVRVVVGCIVALAFNDYTPPPALEAQVVAAYNAAWT